MSRGPGRIQQVVLALIEDDADGAWSTSDICGHAFRGANRVEKKHRVAVSRALRTMPLPETWAIYRADKHGGEGILVNRLSIESQTKRRWIVWPWKTMGYEKWKVDYWHQVDKAREEVSEYRRYYDADEIGRINILIQDEQRRAGLLRSIGGISPEYFKSIAARIEELSARKAALEAAVNVSALPMLQSGNTYEGAPA
jgi:hypothetical protein